MIGAFHNIFHRPQINLSRSTASRMWLVNCCALLGIAQSALSDEGASLVLALTSLISAVAIDLIVHVKSRNFSLKDGSTIATALIFTLLMPNHMHPLVVLIGVAFALFVIKYSFGGLGANWLNPAAGSWLFVMCAWPLLFSAAFAETPLYGLEDALGRNITDPQGSPLNIIKMTGFSGTSTDISFTSMMNTNFFRFLGTKLPDGYIDLFMLKESGIIADRGILGLLMGSIILTASQISRCWLPAIYLAVYAVLIRLFGALPFGGMFGSGDVLFGLLSGGTIVSAFILLADPVTGPKSTIGAVIAAILAGCFSFIFRYKAMFPYGAVFAVVFLNMCVPLIKCLESRLLYAARRKK